MSSGPENRFIKSINNVLKLDIHCEKMHNPFRGGTFDVWYSGKFDLWVEYKWTNKLGKVVVPDLSPLQLLWGRDRYKEGRNVCVIVGHPSGGMVFTNPTQWENGKIAESITKPEVVDWVKRYCLKSSLR